MVHEGGGGKMDNSANAGTGRSYSYRSLRRGTIRGVVEGGSLSGMGVANTLKKFSPGTEFSSFIEPIGGVHGVISQNNVESLDYLARGLRDLVVCKGKARDASWVEGL